MPERPLPEAHGPEPTGALAGAARFWDEQVENPAEESRHWLASPLVARRVNSWVTGRPEVYPVTALGEALAPRLPLSRALSIGCGTGSFEREAVRTGIAERMDGIDVSGAALERARQLAAGEAALAGRIAYAQADAASWLAAAPAGRYQLIAFHGSLHHIAELEAVLSGCEAVLRGGREDAGEGAGWLYLDEYIGPSRDLWCDADLAPARELFARVAPEHRRTPTLDQPMDASDPSEMARSGEIEPLLRAWFEVVSFRPYYGNILYPLLSAIRGDAFTHPAVERLIGEAAEREDALARGGSLRPLFACFLARPRPAAEAAARAAVWERPRRGGAATGLPELVDPGPLPAYETELLLRRLLAERDGEQRDLYREIERLNRLVHEMESTRAWRLHDFWERHVRVPLRRRAGRVAADRTTGTRQNGEGS